MQLPTSLPDETLFSRYVRHMTILGMKEQNYLKTLLNKPRASIHPYLTIGYWQSGTNMWGLYIQDLSRTNVR
jgi:hypothetical protein